MRAARCETYGPPERVVVEQVPDLHAGDGGALVAVHAASVNYPDVLIVADEYQVSIPPPFTPGSEFAGVVVKGFEFRTFAEHAPEAARRDREELLALFAEGKVRPYVSSVYPLDRVGEALREVADRRAIGKVVVEPVP